MYLLQRVLWLPPWLTIDAVQSVTWFNSFHVGNNICFQREVVLRDKLSPIFRMEVCIRTAALKSTHKWTKNKRNIYVVFNFWFEWTTKLNLQARIHSFTPCVFAMMTKTRFLQNVNGWRTGETSTLQRNAPKTNLALPVNKKKKKKKIKSKSTLTNRIIKFIRQCSGSGHAHCRTTDRTNSLPTGQVGTRQSCHTRWRCPLSPFISQKKKN